MKGFFGCTGRIRSIPTSLRRSMHLQSIAAPGCFRSVSYHREFSISDG
jgi:hypothetical protein